MSGRNERRRRAAWELLGAAVLVAGCGGGGSSSGASTTDEWVVLGTSTAAGAGAPAGQGWVAQLAEASAPSGVTVSNAARAGTTTYQWLPAATSRPPQRPATTPELDVTRVLPAAPRVVILAFPSNDAMAGFAAAETVDNLLLLRREARRRGAAVVVTSSQPRNDAGAAQRAAMQAADATLASRLGPCFVDVRSALADRDGGLAPAYDAGDGVHPNAQGHRAIFEPVWAVIAGGRCTALQPE